MTNEHNPIAQLVYKIQQTWIQEIDPFPQIQLVRWLIEEEQSRLYEAFLKLESSPNGQTPDVFVTLLTPFTSCDTYSRDLLYAWFDAMEKDAATFRMLEEKGHPLQWNEESFRQKALHATADFDVLLLELMADFHKALQLGERKLTLALFQYSISSIPDYNKWLEHFVQKNFPPEVRLCIFDINTQRYYDRLFANLHPAFAKTIMVPLDLQDAVKKIIQAGDINDPGVRLQQYIQQMSMAVSARDHVQLEKEGNQCIADMIRSKNKSLMATAHLAYAGMLFHFRKYDSIDDLLNKGLDIALAGQYGGDVSCASLISQFYNFKAAAFHLNKKHKEAIAWYVKSAELSESQHQPISAVAAYRQAALLAQKAAPPEYKKILLAGFAVGKLLSTEELPLSEYALLCLAYHQLLKLEGAHASSDELDTETGKIFGANWKEAAREKSLVSHL